MYVELHQLHSNGNIVKFIWILHRNIVLSYSIWLVTHQTDILSYNLCMLAIQGKVKGRCISVEMFKYIFLLKGIVGICNKTTVLNWKLHLTFLGTLYH